MAARVNALNEAARAPEPAPEKPSLADRVPHDVRAKIPPSVRRAARKALGRER